MFLQENRQFRRVNVAYEAKCRGMAESPAPYKIVEIVDINHQGCRFVGSRNFARGEEVSILADFPPEGPLHFEAVAAWSKPIYKDTIFETGLRFLTYDPASEETYLKLYHFCLIGQPRI